MLVNVQTSKQPLRIFYQRTLPDKSQITAQFLSGNFLNVIYPNQSLKELKLGTLTALSAAEDTKNFTQSTSMRAGFNIKLANVGADITNSNNFISEPTPTPAFGDELEGGYYTGMIWNEAIQSTTSTLIGTGVKTFIVPNMSTTPIFYFGQMVEIRSRANPNNKMIGTVRAAKTTALTIDVTSISGSGTFTDWSIMSRYRIIVAPKAEGENTSLMFKNANAAAGAAAVTLSEGRKATLAMVAADNATAYPAAHWCNNLNINGKTDWYLPARDELELVWRNLKPLINDNYMGARPNLPTVGAYQNLGSYNSTNETGANSNSYPSSNAYTVSDPTRTTSLIFRTGGNQALSTNGYYWSSTDYSANDALLQIWTSATPGAQTNSRKTYVTSVRAVRRSIV